jgi:hypothetical protein
MIAKLTDGGESVASRISLVENNCKVGRRTMAKIKHGLM